MRSGASLGGLLGKAASGDGRNDYVCTVTCVWVQAYLQLFRVSFFLDGRSGAMVGVVVEQYFEVNIPLERRRPCIASLSAIS